MKEKMAEERNFARPVAGSGRDGCLRIVGRLKDMIMHDGELDSFKIPAHFRIVDEMPTTVAGNRKGSECANKWLACFRNAVGRSDASGCFAAMDRIKIVCLARRIAIRRVRRHRLRLQAGSSIDSFAISIASLMILSSPI